MRWKSPSTRYRKRELDSADLLAPVLVTEQAVAATEQLLPTYRGTDGDHEGIVYWCGPESKSEILITTAFAPKAEHTRGSVYCDESSIGETMRCARGYALAIRAQVHSHPGPGSVHSDGDDDLVLTPWQGMLSSVVPRFGHHGLRPLASLGIHQYQEGCWMLIDCANARERITVVPGAVDLRGAAMSSTKRSSHAPLPISATKPTSTLARWSFASETTPTLKPVMPSLTR